MADNNELVAAIDKFTAQVAELAEVFVVAHVELMQVLGGDETQQPAGSLDRDHDDDGAL